MKKAIISKFIGLWAFVAICVVITLTFSVSEAKFSTRYQYAIKLSVAEHFTFSPGNSYNFEIPYDGYYAFQLWGGNGGDAKDVWNGVETIHEIGGVGGEIAAVSYFESGTNLVIVVGAQGGTNGGGLNGGAPGGIDNRYHGGDGGDATDVRFSPGTLNDRILVAGGGGGYLSGNGGNGGTLESGFIGAMGAGNGAGEGGTLHSGGVGYQYGAFGYGGKATYSGGGGGSGYYGGGGGYYGGGGGGGGSSYIGSGFTKNVPEGLPDRESYSSDIKSGYVIVSYLGAQDSTVDTSETVFVDETPTDIMKTISILVPRELREKI